MPDRYPTLDACVHCGFCLPACPTYLATGDENDSPRGRIVLMHELAAGNADPAIPHHLDNCLGCLGCEPACPSGVGYGTALQTARETLFATRSRSPVLAALLAVFSTPRLWRPAFTLARWVRTARLAQLFSGSGRLGFAAGMLAATTPSSGPRHTGSPPPEEPRATVGLFRGCVMDTLFGHVHAATRRTLEANGYEVIDLPGLTCCGALHEHAGASEEAAALARQNVAAVPDHVDFLAVNSAGCGAILKNYDRLLGTRASAHVAARVRDVSELLAEAGPRQGGRLDLRVAYDAPCHLHHAQGVTDAPRALLGAIPGLTVVEPEGSDRCCGSAGLYSLERPAMARAVLQAKLESILADRNLAVVATGNPGCLMHIGAGLRAAGSRIETRHPVELLDRSYQAAGLYGHAVPS